MGISGGARHETGGGEISGMLAAGVWRNLEKAGAASRGGGGAQRALAYASNDVMS